MQKIFMFLMVAAITMAAGPALAENALGGTVEAAVNGRTIHFPTLKSDYQATVEGDLVTVRLVQTFANPASVPLNAVYLFPLSTEAAVYEMIMETGDERVAAKIKKVEEARRDYEAAKSEGKAASLLSQKRPNMFTQEIANLMPGRPVTVTISYVETARRTDGFYELVLPLVVGPRYQPAGAGTEPGLAEPEEGTAAMNSLAPPISVDETRQAKADSSRQYGQWELESLPAYPPVGGLTIPKIIDADRVGLNINLKAGFPVLEAGSQTHELAVEKISKRELNLSLAKGRAVDNRDFILRWRLAGESVQAGLLARKDRRGGFLSLLIEPPAMPAAEEIAPRELVFVLDTSGSMHGHPLEASKKFMRRALKSLRPSDAFRLITFNSAAHEYSSSPLPATPANLQAARDHIDRLSASGGTEAAAAVRQAFIVPESGRLRLVVFLTDGYIGNEAQVLGEIGRIIGGARIYALGVGASVNRYLLEEMARAGRGWCRILNPTDNNEDVAQELAARLNDPVLTDLSVDWGDLAVTSAAPQILPDIFAGQSLRVAGRYEKGGHYEISVSGLVNGRRARMPLSVDLPDEAAPDGGPQGIALIWARGEIGELMRRFNTPEGLPGHGGDHDAIKKKVIELGLDFNLVTQWTAFVAVSEKIVNEGRAALDSQVPLNQAAGVSAPAYGLDSGSNGNGGGPGFSSTPEPASLGGLAVLAAAAWAARRRRRP